jgi:hypothetical protein
LEAEAVREDAADNERIEALLRGFGELRQKYREAEERIGLLTEENATLRGKMYHMQRPIKSWRRAAGRGTTIPTRILCQPRRTDLSGKRPPCLLVKLITHTSTRSRPSAR